MKQYLQKTKIKDTKDLLNCKRRGNYEKLGKKGNEKLDNVTTVCAKIEEYREARKTAKQNQSDLSKAKENPPADFNEQDFLSAISSCEKIMNDCENTINSICGR